LLGNLRREPEVVSKGVVPTENLIATTENVEVITEFGLSGVLRQLRELFA